MRSVVLLLLAVACKGSSDAPPTQTIVTTTEQSPPTSSIITEIPEEGSIVISSFLPDSDSNMPQLQIAAIGVETRRGWENLAQCLSDDEAWCLDEWPVDDGGESEVVAFEDWMFLNLASRSLGPVLEVGTYTLPEGVIDPGLSVYYGMYPNTAPLSGEVPIKTSGVWGAYNGTATAPTALILSSPDPMSEQSFPSTDPVPLRWNGDGVGEVYVLVFTRGDNRVFHVEDDGEFDLDLSSFNLEDGDDVDLVVGRWSVENLNVNDNNLQVQIQVNQRVQGEYRELTGAALVPALTCNTARTAPTVNPGDWWGFTQGEFKTLNGEECTRFTSGGRESFVPVEVGPRQLLEVDYSLFSANASLYIVPDCTNGNTCLVGSDTGGIGANEHIAWYNDSDEMRRVYIVLDTYPNTGPSSVFQLAFQTTEFTPDVLVNTCAEALTANATPPAAYFGNLAGSTNVLAPSCAGEDLIGGEGMTKILLEAGQTLTVEAWAANTDPALYLLYNCTIEDSCITTDGSDEHNEFEALTYTNLTGVSENLYLVLDAPNAMTDYLLDIQVQ